MKKVSQHYIFITALLVLALVYFNGILHKGVIMNNVHYINDLAFVSYNTKEALGSNSLPLWTPYFYAGQPLLGIAENYMFDMNFLLIYFFRNIYFAMNFSLIFYFLASGIGMYFLVYNLAGSKKAALVSAAVYMLNGFMQSFLIHGHLNLIEGYALAPFIFLFVHKALKTKEWVLYSILAGVFFALQILAGSMIFFFYTALLVLFYMAFNLASKNFANVLVKSAFVGVILVAVALGLASIKLLPVLEFTKMSSRSANVSFAEFLGAPVDLKDAARILVTDIGYGGISAAAGIAGFILLALGLLNYKKKTIIFFFLLIIFSLLFASNTIVAGLMYKIPGFDRLRHVERALMLSAFACSVLAGYGFVKLWDILGKKRTFPKYSNFVFGLVMILILAELLLLHNFPSPSKIIQPEEIGVLDYMSRDNSTFRTINLAQNDIIGAAGYNYYAQKKISEVKGGGGIWINDYANFVGVAQQSLSSKMFGILNVKYVVAEKKISAENITLVQMFNSCRECAIWNAFGPYLYKNENFLPRYYTVPNSILVVGNGQMSASLIYSIMFQKWSPANSVLIEGTKINDYEPEFLSHFSAIILAQESVDDQSIVKLRNYVSKGGTIFPDILKRQNNLLSSDVDNFFSKTGGSHSEIKIKSYSSNRIVLQLDGQKGWLVASERFAFFPGWAATINGKKIDILKADNAISAMYLDGSSGELVFEYHPESYKNGRLISSISLIAIIACLAYFAYTKKKAAKGNPRNSEVKISL